MDADDNTSQYVWRCQGSNGGTEANPWCSTPKVSTNHDPKGNFESITCDKITGWTCDEDNYATSLDVHIYKDGPAGGGGTMVASGTANVSRSDVFSACGGTTAHGFSIDNVGVIRDGAPHTYTYYAHPVNTPSGNNPALNGGAGRQATLTCGSAPATVPCGTANGKVYPNGTTGFGTDTQCPSGANPMGDGFPAAGTTSSWTCRDSWGNFSTTCSASQNGGGGGGGGSSAMCGPTNAAPSCSNGFVVSSSVTSSTIGSTTYYGWNCDDAGPGHYGGPVACTSTVTVGGGGPPTATISASPNPVASGNSTTLSWTTTNAGTCYLIGGQWNIYTSVNCNSSATTNGLMANTTYTLVAYSFDMNQATSADVTVTVGAGVPSTFKVCPSTFTVYKNTSTSLGAYYDARANCSDTSKPISSVNASSWTSDNNAAISVNASGTATGVGSNGTATITAKYTPSGGSELSASSVGTVACVDSYTYVPDPITVCSDKRDVRKINTGCGGEEMVYGLKNCNKVKFWREVAP